MDLIIYTSSYGQMNVNTVAGINNLYHKSKLEFDWTSTGSDALIGRGRSIACTDFLDNKNAPYMLFLDGDIIFSPDNVQQIYDALRDGCDVVGGLYSVTDSEFLASHPGQHSVLEIDGKVQEIDHLATGFMGISRKILKQMVEKLELPMLQEGSKFECYPFFESGRRGKIYISEDYDFDEKVREAGGKVYAHTGVQVGHEKLHINYPQEAISKTEIIDPLLLADAKEYLGHDITISDLKKAALITSEGFEQWTKTGSIEDYYRNNKDYFMDLLAFNTGRDYRLRWYGIQQIKDSKILDIGCGIGTMAIYLAGKGCEVVGHDISKQCIEFAKWRVKKHGFKNVKFTLEKPSCKGFDYILAIDVLEHIEDLGGFLKDIASTMDVGAKLYHFDKFETNDRCKQHFDHRGDIDRYLKEAGLMKFNRFWAIKTC